jgi:hypothetical protein
MPASHHDARPMNDDISRILGRMAALEDDLRTAVHQQESRISFRIKGKRVEFERSIQAAHLKLRKSFFRWLAAWFVHPGMVTSSNRRPPRHSKRRHADASAVRRLS